MIAAAVITLGLAALAGLLSGGSDSETVVAVALVPVPEGPVFTLSRGQAQWSEIRLPTPLPKPLAQTCSSGSDVVVTLADGETIGYGPCKRPLSIAILREDLLRVAHSS